ncbi:MAG: LppX_LprAFG lipoprotein [Janibacter sp.]
MLRTTTTVAAAAALALTLTACGGGDGGPGPTAGDGFGNSSTPAAPSTSEGDPNSSTPSGTSSASASAEGTSETSSSSSSSSTSTDTGKPFDADEFTTKIEEAIDANPSASIEVLLTVDGKDSGSATGIQDLENEALDMDLSFGGQELGYRLVDGKYYLAQGEKWIPVTEGSTNKVVENALDQAELLSLRRQLDAFVAGVEKAGDKGSEEIDGVKTTHYTATVDTAKAYESLGMEQDAGTPETMIYDVWLDEDDLIRRMSFTQEGSEAVMTASDWGEPVDIAKPKDSEIVEAK